MVRRGTNQREADRALLPLQRQNTYRARYREKHPDWWPATDLVEAMVRARRHTESRMLDLGCGRGGVVELFWRDVKVAVGLDPDPPSLAEHRAAGMPVIRGVGERLPFVDATLDMIVCVWVLEHLVQPLDALREVRRVLRPGGRFIFLTPNLRHPLVAANRIGGMVPRLQRRIVPRMYGRGERDTFPVRYRANTPEALRRLATESGLVMGELRVVRDPTYLAMNETMFRLSTLGESLLPSSRGIHLVGELIRE